MTLAEFGLAMVIVGVFIGLLGIGFVARAFYLDDHPTPCSKTVGVTR